MINNNRIISGKLVLDNIKWLTVVNNFLDLLRDIRIIIEWSNSLKYIEIEDIRNFTLYIDLYRSCRYFIFHNRNYKHV